MMNVFLVTVALLLGVTDEPVTETSDFASFVEAETDFFCERRLDDSLSCKPGRVVRTDGVAGLLFVDPVHERLGILFPDGVVYEMPDGAHICEWLSAGDTECFLPHGEALE